MAPPAPGPGPPAPLQEPAGGEGPGWEPPGLACRAPRVLPRGGRGVVAPGGAAELGAGGGDHLAAGRAPHRGEVLAADAQRTHELPARGVPSQHARLDVGADDRPAVVREDHRVNYVLISVE